MTHTWDPKSAPLTTAEEELLTGSKAVSKLSQSQLDSFNAWVGSKNPGVLEAKSWITRGNDLYYNTFSYSELVLMIKRAKYLYSNEGNIEDKVDFIIRKPGLGLPLGHMPDQKDRFPLLFMEDNYENGWRAATLLIRESCMLKLINELSDKPEWWRKVKDEAISSKWKKEALEMDWTSYRKHADFTSAMADACISELRNKAELYEKAGLMPVYDYTTTVIKSDSLLTPDLAKALQEGVKPLEDVPSELKDWHPNSKEQVLDLVHPSLWPLIYGRSRVLNDRVIEVDNALASCGTGVVPRAPGSEQTTHIIGEGGFCEDEVVVLSNKFQWLPCDVDLDPETGKAKIASYINNLHPQEHAHLYPIIEKFIEKSLPAWDIIYDWENTFSVQRLTTTEAEYDECPCPDLCDIEDGYGCTPWRRPIGEGEEPRYDVDSWEEMLADEKAEDYKTNPERRNLDDAWFASTHSAKLPDADPSAKDHMRIQPSDVKANGFFNSSSQIQVIVKLANIHLTPEKPVYNGGSWHTEGLLNEHIVSTALYYYDSENITDCTLDFRTCADKEDLAAEISYEQYRHDPIERTFDITLGGSIFQDIGSVLTKAGRALFFPNVLQHHVSQFRLADPTKPGHRKILALFLVDPAIPIVSASNVPPQQKHWWTTHSGLESGCGIMPPELIEKGG
ncbi:hypothetical protein FOC4_g10000837 [Fusarium odoratissimum]|uniref:Uncharacterized protein n=1 Tax=Fusarium oxysporum f. sp. cubense (strain race 4) TaxID=2502994 RepID=N1SBG9_FUSC4|nr:hypothetical protein FOC4_g10000837 [Fusarium odoratissimum]